MTFMQQKIFVVYQSTETKNSPGKSGNSVLTYFYSDSKIVKKQWGDTKQREKGGRTEENLTQI